MGSIRSLDAVKTPRSAIKALCNSRLLKSQMRLKKNRPFNYWLKSLRARDTISWVFLPQAVGTNTVHLRHETKTRVTA